MVLSEADAANLLERAARAERQARGNDALTLLEGCETWPVPCNERGVLLRASVLTLRDPIASLEALPEDINVFTTRATRVRYWLHSARAYMALRNFQAAEDALRSADAQATPGDDDEARWRAFYRARLRLARREYHAHDPDLAFALQTSDPDLRLRAIHTRAWMRAADEDYHGQMSDLLACVRVYEEHRECSSAVVAEALRSIFILAWDIGDVSAVIQALRAFERFQWTPEIRSEKVLGLRGLAWIGFLTGDEVPLESYLSVADREDSPVALRLLANLDAAYMARLKRDEPAARNRLVDSQALEAMLDWRALRGEERSILLTLAVLLARDDAPAAERYFSTYRSLHAHSMHERIDASREPRRVVALQRYAEGRIAQAGGHMRIARGFLEQAHGIFAGVGHAFRAALAAHAMFQVTGDADWLARALAHAGVYPRSPLVTYMTS